MSTQGAQSLPRRPAPPRLLGLAAVIVVLGAAAAAAVLLAGRDSGSPAPAGHEAARYGGIPKWLPQTKASVERVLTATAAKPVLAIQGNSVSARLRHGRVLVTAVGPQVPETGEFPVPSTSPSTFVVTFARAAGAVPIRPGDFTVVDDQGHLHHPHVTALEGGAPPRRVPAGQTISLRVQGVLPTGNGGLSWTPAGGRPIVTWDFNLEID